MNHMKRSVEEVTICQFFEEMSTLLLISICTSSLKGFEVK